MQFELTREFIDKLRIHIDNKEEVAAFEMVKELHPADIAEIYEELDIDEAKFLHLLLDGETAADVMVELEEDDRERFLEALPSEFIAKQLIDKMESDDAADLIGELSDEKQEEVISYIEDLDQAGDIVDLLNYDEDTAGGLMAKELITVNENWNMPTCLKEMRKQAAEIDEVYYVYVVDDNNILKGTLSLKRMLLASANANIKNILNTDVISVRTDTKSEEVANIMEKYNLVALPVVDALGRLVGRITIDDVVDVMREEAERDYQLVSGITTDVEHSDSPWLLTRARIPWLFIGLFGGIIGALVIGNYETDLGLYPQMAFFIPLIAAMGGNVGVQSSSIIVQALATNSLGFDSIGKKLSKELLVAGINGIILSTVIFTYNYFFSDSFALTITVSCALFSVIIFASLFGTFVPMFLGKMKIDPALATGPFITTVNDIMGLFLYLMIGRLFFAIF
ncbi:MAG: magnesium transporter [Bacteroidetes bacterium GWC2_33_15]|nr:MAG: magnesium transporter [Bacteroidetes bacterium GWA2_33_15]OFX51899.1 MAG: magnesium transporter [Bacteroidetes bacterium GWC2_33_15]OFX63467.1 MAG: magnesium transporter [Bacteroidetes bacterium GWB2_32_14]OFX67184.1 MAG: magnesium transporter [Bacteroidetes bacterium GWD2_33_33]HAN17092.1 magnesium transporter [Bacteroidales bacterium]